MLQPLHKATPAELKERLAAERAGSAFFVLRDADGVQQIVTLDPAAAPLTIGRDEGVSIRLRWDLRVSRVHAELSCIGGHWTVSDDGLSRNGTFVAGERIDGRRRLQDGDQLKLGATALTFRSPALATSSPAGATATSTPTATADVAPEVTEAQRRVAVALCRPFGGGDTFAKPATNRQIADELTLSVPGVKAHLRALVRAYGLEDLPQNDKRLRLVERLIRTGVVDEREL